MTEEILQAIGGSLVRNPEIPPSPPLDPAPVLPALQVLEQNLARLQAIVEQADENGRAIDRDLEATVAALRRWFGQEEAQQPASGAFALTV